MERPVRRDEPTRSSPRGQRTPTPSDELLRLIHRGIIPESWAVNGGLGTAEIKRGILTVTNSLDVHALLGAPVIVGR